MKTTGKRKPDRQAVRRQQREDRHPVPGWTRNGPPMISSRWTMAEAPGRGAIIAFRAISCRFLEGSIPIGLSESRGSYSAAAFLPGTHSWATSNPSHAESAFRRSLGGSSAVAWRIVSIASSGSRPSSQSGGGHSTCRSVLGGRSAFGGIRSCGPSGRVDGREDRPARFRRCQRPAASMDLSRKTHQICLQWRLNSC